MEVIGQLHSATFFMRYEGSSSTHELEVGWAKDSTWKFWKREFLAFLLEVKDGMIETRNNCCAVAQLA